MIRKIFPARFDNQFPGCPPGLWLFVPVVLVKLAIGSNSLFNTRFVAETVDGIALSRFPSEAASAVTAFFAIWGMGQVILALLGLLALLRYRAMIPFFYLLMVIEQVGRSSVFLIHPAAQMAGPALAPSRASPTDMNAVMLIVLIIGLALSIAPRHWARLGPNSES